MRFDSLHLFSRMKLIFASTLVAAFCAASPLVFAIAPTPTICSNGVIIYSGACPTLPKAETTVVNRCTGQVGQALTDCKRINLASCIPLAAGPKKRRLHETL